jgi:hypothetical protein
MPARLKIHCGDPGLVSSQLTPSLGIVQVASTSQAVPNCGWTDQPVSSVPPAAMSRYWAEVTVS